LNLVTKFDVAAEKYTKEGRLVIKVYEDSPAAKLGIKKGWVLSKIGTNSATNKSIFNAEVSTSSKELILVDNDNTVWNQ
jgi:S1-C subfamily serine protease